MTLAARHPFAVALAATFLFACGNGSTGGNGSGGGNGGDDSNGGAGGFFPTGPTTGGGDTKPRADCPAYCTTIMKNCADENAEYASEDQCLAACTAMSTDAVDCRSPHAGYAESDKMHCPHAGIQGACGDTCTAFCEVARDACPSAWPSQDACTSDCNSFPAIYDVPWNAAAGKSSKEKNDFSCRLYHLLLVSSDSGECANVGKASSACVQ